MSTNPADRPAHLRPYALVMGEIESAPLDLADRMERVYAALRATGWRVVVRSVGTDFGAWFPTPQNQPVQLLIHREDRPYTPEEAQQALTNVLRGLNMSYSAWGAWAGEINEHVVKPTVQSATGGLAVFAGIAAVAFLLGRSR